MNAINFRGRCYRARRTEDFTVGQLSRLVSLARDSVDGADGTPEQNKRDREYWGIVSPQLPADLYFSATAEEKQALVDQSAQIVSGVWDALTAAYSADRDHQFRDHDQ